MNYVFIGNNNKNMGNVVFINDNCTAVQQGNNLTQVNSFTNGGVQVNTFTTDPDKKITQQWTVNRFQ